MWGSCSGVGGNEAASELAGGAASDDAATGDDSAAALLVDVAACDGATDTTGLGLTTCVEVLVHDASVRAAAMNKGHHAVRFTCSV
jgi:hypothetical protein